MTVCLTVPPSCGGEDWARERWGGGRDRMGNQRWIRIGLEQRTYREYIHIDLRAKWRHFRILTYERNGRYTKKFCYINLQSFYLTDKTSVLQHCMFKRSSSLYYLLILKSYKFYVSTLKWCNIQQVKMSDDREKQDV